MIYMYWMHEVSVQLPCAGTLCHIYFSIILLFSLGWGFFCIFLEANTEKQTKPSHQQPVQLALPVNLISNFRLVRT